MVYSILVILIKKEREGHVYVYDAGMIRKGIDGYGEG